MATKNKTRLEALKTESSSDYNDYKNHVDALQSEINDVAQKYNTEINIINNQRIEIRHELEVLYKFLEPLGNMLDKKVTIFDFESEAPATIPKMDINIQKIESPDYLEHEFWSDSILAHISKHNKNKKRINDYEIEVEKQKNEYDEKLKALDSIKRELETAWEIAKIYRTTVVIVRDAVKDKIIPETRYILAFLYADAAREMVINDTTDVPVQMNSILEYEMNSKYSMHFEFVRNAFDFYEILERFFKKTILTDIVEDCIVTEEEQKGFEEGINAVKEGLNMVEEKAVVYK